MKAPIPRRAGRAALLALTLMASGPALAQETTQGLDVTPRNLAFAQALSSDTELSEYYRARDYAPIWTAGDSASQARRAALIMGMRMAPLHGLPESKYQPDALIARMSNVRGAAELARLEIELSKIYLDLASDLHTGILTPSKVVPLILRKVPLQSAATYLDGLQNGDPADYIRALPPQTAEYLGLLKAKFRLQDMMERGGYGAQVHIDVLKPGATGREVIALRDRLTALGYMKPSVSASYDATMEAAVSAFQRDTGLAEDGVAGPATMEQINIPVSERLESITVALERERWLNMPRGDRHVLVNLTDFSARIVDFDHVTFETRSVVGANRDGRRTPEFSDEMEHLIINPTWHVPRSIVVGEYLPQIQRNPNAASQLNIIDRAGRVVPRDAVDWTQFNASNFPFAMKQPPSNRNALGLVKFMFPNKNNIYLHDTPSKSLFQRNVRAFSHGCIRLQDPFDFAYALLAVQEDDPESFFQSRLRSGRETQVNLETHVPVHLIYRTAVVSPKGQIGFRQDIYGRDAKIWDALAAQGVTLDPVRG